MVNSVSEDEYAARLISELERRQRVDPMAFYEASSDKVEQFHASPAMTRALFGGNRSGKTEGALQDVLWHLRGDHPYMEVPKPPVYWRFVVVDYKQVEKVINEKLRRMMPPSLMKGGGWEKTYNTRTNIMTLANGSQIDVMTHEQPLLAFEGSARHGTFFDEEPPEEIYTSCILRHVDYGGKTIMAMTPLKGLTWVYPKIYLRSFTDGRVQAWTLSIYDNKFLSQAQINEIEALITDDVDKEIRLYGKFTSRTGLVFRSFDPQVHIYDPHSSYFEGWWDNEFPPVDWLQIVAIDPGWGHPTGVLWLAVNPDNTDRFWYREHKMAEMLPEEHAEIIHAYNKEMGVINPVYVIDSQAKATDQKGGSVWGDYKDNGIIARPGTKKLHEGNIKLARTMRVLTDPRGKPYSHFHVSKDCPQFIEEIGDYQRAKPTEMMATDRYVDKKNDLISSARYGEWEVSRIDFDAWMEERDQVLLKKPEKRSPIRRYPEDKKKPVRKGFEHTGY